MTDTTAQLMRDMSEPVASLTVFYDGSCPLCVREINFFRKRAPGTDIAWVDVSEEALPLQTAPGLTCEAAMARCHVLEAGQKHSGAKAFVRLWSYIPGFKRLSAVMDNRPMIWIGEKAYRLFLRIRPLLQRLVRRVAS